MQKTIVFVGLDLNPTLKFWICEVLRIIHNELNEPEGHSVFPMALYAQRENRETSVMFFRRKAKGDPSTFRLHFVNTNVEGVHTKRKPRLGGLLVA